MTGQVKTTKPFPAGNGFFLFIFRGLRGFNGVLSDHPVRYLLDGEHGSCRMEDITVADCDIDVEGSPITFSVEPGVTLRDFGTVTFRNVEITDSDVTLLFERSARRFYGETSPAPAEGGVSFDLMY